MEPNLYRQKYVFAGTDHVGALEREEAWFKSNEWINTTSLDTSSELLKWYNVTVHQKSISVAKSGNTRSLANLLTWQS